MLREVSAEEMTFELGFVGRVGVYKARKGIPDNKNSACNRGLKLVASSRNCMWFGGAGTEGV